MKTISSSGSVKSGDPAERTDWLLITFWATYFSIVIGFLYAVISEGI